MILVTGGTGRLGRPTVAQLEAAGHMVRVLSRSTGGDLSTGLGLNHALDGVDTVVHLATTGSAKDSAQTRRLLAAVAGRITHLVFISIVGVDRIPYSYYRSKVVSERMIEESGIPFTILRATQFHDFVAAALRPQAKWPVTISIDVPVQPIAVDEVATRLVELAVGHPQRRVPDIGGPEVLSVTEFATQWNRAHGRQRKVWTLHLPGKIGKAFRDGNHTTSLPGFGRQTFAEYAEKEAAT